MAQNAPACKETQEVQFKLHDKFVAFKKCGEPRSNVKLLAISSTRGLLFAGNPTAAELKVFIIKDLADAKQTCKQPQTRQIPLPSLPNNINCSTDGNLLAINYTQNGTGLLSIYSVQSFMTANIKPMYNIRLAPEDYIYAVQLLWNPVLPNSLAVVLSNGALCMYALKDSGNFEVFTLDKSNQVKCGCWSPKGKQIVLGFPNGKLQQFKPDLTPAKTVVCPPNVHEAPFDTIALHWLSTFQFAVVFLQHGENCNPALYIVNAPKGGPPTYTNYYDICYSLNGPRNHQFDFTHVPQWNLLLVSSANGVEVGVMGTQEIGDTPTWLQFTPLDSARIELPLCQDTQEETFPLGFTFDTSSTHQLIVDDQKLATMPMVHLLGTDGTLLCFDFLNLMPGAVSVCSPPPPAADSSGQFRPLDKLLALEEKPVAAATTDAVPPTGLDLSFAFTPNTVTSTPAPTKDKQPSLFSGFGVATGKAAPPQLAFGSVQPTSTSTPVPAFAPAATATKPVPSFTGFGSSLNAPSAGSFFGAPATATTTAANSVSIKPAFAGQSLDKPNLFGASTAVDAQVKSTNAIQTTPASNKPLYTVPSTFTLGANNAKTLSAAVNIAKAESVPHQELNNNDMEEIINHIMAVQINAFTEEIQQVKKNNNIMLSQIENPASIKSFSKRLDDLQVLNEQASDVDFELELQGLRHGLNESYSMIAECRAKLEMYKNPDITRLMSSNTYDPASHRILARLRSYVAANEALLSQAQQQIDTQWEQHQDVLRRSSKSKMNMPCLEGIYQRLTKLQNQVSKQRYVQNTIKEKLKQRGLLQPRLLEESSRSRTNEAVDTLAETIINMSLSQVVDNSSAKLNSEKLQAIRNMVQTTKIKIIKPQRPDRIGLKSEVIMETKLKAERKKKEAIAAAAKPSTVNKSIQTAAPAQLSKPSATKPITATAPLQEKKSIASSTPFPMSNASSFVKSTAGIAPTTTLNSGGDGKPATSMFGGISTFSGSPFSFSQAATSTTIKPTLAIGGIPAAKPPAAAGMFSGFGSHLEANKPQGESLKEMAKLAEVKKEEPTATEQVKPPQTPKADAAPVKPFSFAGFGGLSEGGSAPANTVSSTTKSPFSFGGFGSSLGMAPAHSTAITKTPSPAFVATTIASTTTASTGLFAAANTASTTIATSGIFTTTINAPTTSANTGLFGAATVTPTTPPASGLFGAANKPSFDTVVSSSTPTTAAISSPFSAPATVATATSGASVITTTVATNVASSPTTAVSSTAPTANPINEIFGNVTICKPTAKDGAGDTSNDAPTTEAFAGLGAASNNTGSFKFGEASTAGGDASRGFFANAVNNAAATTAAVIPTQVTTPTTSTVSAPATTLATATTSAAPVAVPASELAVAQAPAIGGSSFSFSNAFSSLSTSTTPGATAATPVNPFAAAQSATPATPFGGAAFAPLPSATPFQTPTAATAAVAPPTGNIFGNVPKPEPSAFGAATAAPTGGIFGSATSTPPVTSPFGSPTGAGASGGNIFGGQPAAASSIFGGATAPTNAASPFGGNSIFGTNNASATASPASGVASTGGSIFGQSAFGQAAQAAPVPAGGNIFTSPQPATNAFGASVGGSVFGGAANTAGGASGGSIFGGGSPGFGSFSQTPTAAGTFSGGFGQAAAGGAFGQGDVSVAQSGFGTPQAQAAQQPGGFGAKPVFGGAPAFGSPPAFGASPTFGGAATFGSPKGFGAFGGSATTASPTSFGAAVAPPKANIFETLGATDSGLSFGNLAQTGNPNAQKPAFGGSSFMNYR